MDPNLTLESAQVTRPPKEEKTTDPIQRQPFANVTNTIDDSSSRPRDKASEGGKESSSASYLKDQKLGNMSRVPNLTQQTVKNVDVMVKYTIYWVNQAEDGKVYHINIELPHQEIVFDAIKDIIPYLNEKIALENSNYQLSTDPDKFELYIAKRTGHPKTDFPAMDNNQILSQSGVRQLNLSEKEPSGIITKVLQPTQTASPVKTQESQHSTAMVEPSMIDTPSFREQIREDPEGEVVTKVKTICWCIPVREKIKIKNRTKENELQANLLQKKQE